MVMAAIQLHPVYVVYVDRDDTWLLKSTLKKNMVSYQPADLYLL